MLVEDNELPNYMQNYKKLIAGRKVRVRIIRIIRTHD